MKKGLYLTTKHFSPDRSRIATNLLSQIHDTTPKAKHSNYFNETTKIKSYAQHHTEKSLCSTLQRSHTHIDFNNFSLSPENKSKQKEPDVVDKKVKVLQEWGSRRNLRHEENIFRHRMKELKKLQEKPNINEHSKQLYRSVSKKKNLAKNVLTRFEFYQSQRIKKNIDNIVRVYVQQTKQVPTIKQLLRTNRKQLVDLLKNIRT